MKCFVVHTHEITGWDRARHHRVNACGKEHGQQSGVERLKGHKQQRQGREVELNLGHMNCDPL